MSEDQALFDKGLPIRREVLGADYVDGSIAKADDFMMAFQRATTAWAWGWAWGDPTLDRKTRSLLNLAMLTALGKVPEIKLHVKGALNNGVSVANLSTATTLAVVSMIYDVISGLTPAKNPSSVRCVRLLARLLLR